MENRAIVKMPYKEKNSLLVILCFISSSALVIITYYSLRFSSLQCIFLDYPYTVSLMDDRIHSSQVEDSLRGIFDIINKRSRPTGTQGGFDDDHCDAKWESMILQCVLNLAFWCRRANINKPNYSPWFGTHWESNPGRGMYLCIAKSNIEINHSRIHLDGISTFYL